jgi:hypothetical protein
MSVEKESNMLRKIFLDLLVFTSSYVKNESKFLSFVISIFRGRLL